ncbi:hypothetical protein CHS0354_000641 [Potamilus streckersoni]|uniref:MoeA N-terminal and linker domain-containing protein n=1 Tax=Potamilus streckersoni TaxID=2493646 RepID=A0AAE0T6Z8_9BIVA|nr:hypothetical protein CHS0354_000641 [Potamilus streckersoni]
MDVPSFDNSSVDGYCFRYEDFENNIPLKITHTIFAGQTKIPKIKAGETFRIFTGAMVPKNADTVVMQEHTSAVDGYLHIHNKLEKGGISVGDFDFVHRALVKNKVKECLYCTHR